MADQAVSEAGRVEAAAGGGSRWLGPLRDLFLSRGILPFLLVGCFLLFGAIEPRFLGGENLFNVARNSTYLIIVCMGQMLTLLIRGIDMAVGSTVALVSVVTALVITAVLAAYPEATTAAIAAGIVAGLAVGMMIGAVHGIGIAVFNVNPFIMTVGMMSIAFGLALKLSGGMPVYGLPPAFSTAFAYWRLWGIPVAALFTAVLFGLMYFLLNWTRLGRYIYAIGGNRTASHLAGINTRRVMAATYILCSTLVAFAGILLTARTETGEATMGSTMVIESITAVVIAGVSFFGGIGKVGNVVLGALFVTLVTNGMNLIRIDSYVQQVVLGALLIVAVVSDQIRMRVLRQRPVE
jgi:ribose transport system permease protein